jgi:hypothetical protein
VRLTVVESLQGVPNLTTEASFVQVMSAVELNETHVLVFRVLVVSRELLNSMSCILVHLKRTIATARRHQHRYKKS